MSYHGHCQRDEFSFFKKNSLGAVSAKAENEYQVYADLPLPSGYSQAKINTMPLRSTYSTVFSEVSSGTEDSQDSNSRAADTLLANWGPRTGPVEGLRDRISMTKVVTTSA